VEVGTYYGIRGLPLQLISPTLFTLYNDLPKASNFTTTPFADNTCLKSANKNTDILKKMVDYEINKVDC